PLRLRAGFARGVVARLRDGEQLLGDGEAAEVDPVGGEAPAAAAPVTHCPVLGLAVALGDGVEAVVHRVDARLEVLHVALVVRLGGLAGAERVRGDVEARVAEAGPQRVAGVRSGGPARPR